MVPIIDDSAIPDPSKRPKVHYLQTKWKHPWKLFLGSDEKGKPLSTYDYLGMCRSTGPDGNMDDRYIGKSLRYTRTKLKSDGMTLRYLLCALVTVWRPIYLGVSISELYYNNTAHTQQSQSEINIQTVSKIDTVTPRYLLCALDDISYHHILAQYIRLQLIHMHISYISVYV